MNIKLMAEQLRICKECKSNGGQCNECTKARAIMDVMKSADSESLLELDSYMRHQEQLSILQRMHEAELEAQDRFVSACVKIGCCVLIILGIIILGGVLK